MEPASTRAGAFRSMKRFIRLNLGITPSLASRKSWAGSQPGRCSKTVMRSHGAQILQQYLALKEALQSSPAPNRAQIATNSRGSLLTLSQLSISEAERSSVVACGSRRRWPTEAISTVLEAVGCKIVLASMSFFRNAAAYRRMKGFIGVAQPSAKLGPSICQLDLPAREKSDASFYPVRGCSSRRYYSGTARHRRCCCRDRLPCTRDPRQQLRSSLKR